MILEKQLAVSTTINRKSITLAEVQKQSRLLGQSRDVVKDPGISHSPLHYSEHWLQSQASSPPLCGMAANNQATCLLVHIQQESMAS